MKKRFTLVPLLALLALAAGCGHLSLDSAGNANRVATGTVALPDGAALPPDAVMVIRIVDPNPVPTQAPLATSAAPKMNLPPEIVAEQTFRDLGASPIPFRVEYSADDDELRRGLSIEARISFAGRLQYSNLTRYTIGLSDAGDPHQISVDRM